MSGDAGVEPAAGPYRSVSNCPPPPCCDALRIPSTPVALIVPLAAPPLRYFLLASAPRLPLFVIVLVAALRSVNSLENRSTGTSSPATTHLVAVHALLNSGRPPALVEACRAHEGLGGGSPMCPSSSTHQKPLEQAQRFGLWRRISTNAKLWGRRVPSGQIYGAESTPNVGMAEIRRYNPVVWREIHAIPRFGGAVWRNRAVET